MLNRLFPFLLVLLSYLIFALPTFAKDYDIAYKVDYYVSGLNAQIETRAQYEINITHLRSDVYVKKYSLIFPSSFKVKNISASDEKDKINPDVDTTSQDIRVDLELNDPNVGKNSVNVLKLEFDQDNLFRKNGSIWEVMLPIINDDYTDYEVALHLPDTDKKISIAKPLPENVVSRKEVKTRTITWKNPQTKTIYAVFGDNQLYKTELTYHLENPKLVPVYTDVAFPPDTLYQKIYISSIDPKPDKVYLDEDGNFMGRYFLKPKESKNIVFKGSIEIFSRPREEVITPVRSSFEMQKSYLLNANNYWLLSKPEQFSKLKTPKEIYDFVIGKLEYNYTRAQNNISRLGAEKSLSTPGNAVCVEFTDLFIAIARENGIKAREIQGFGFSNDQKLRPLSLVSDILHSWPEYYDEQKDLWVAVDPTWEDTSGIDYFTSLDFNHITFAIHGKRDDYPLPAGTYKIENSKDIMIQPDESTPEEVRKLIVESGNIPKDLHDQQKGKIKLIVKNAGNTFLRNVPIEAISNVLKTNVNPTRILTLAPYETLDVYMEYSAMKQSKKIQTKLKIQIGDTTIERLISITPFYYFIALKVALALFIVSSIIFLARKLTKAKRKNESSQANPET